MAADVEREFTEYVTAATPRLFRTALALTGDRQQAEDLLQTVLASAYPRWRDIAAGQPDSYLRRAMYLRSVSRWRLRWELRAVLLSLVDAPAPPIDSPSPVPYTPSHDVATLTPRPVSIPDGLGAVGGPWCWRPVPRATIAEA